MSSLLMDKIIRFVNSTEYDALPDEIKKTSKYAITDTVGVALAGWNESCVQILKKTYKSRKSGGEMSLLWGDAYELPLEITALINGTAAHALDFDDVTPTVLAHPSAPIVSSIIPIAEYLEKSGRELITSYAIGTEVMIRIGQVMGFNHYNLGWHATSTLGTIGATTACGYLFQLGEKELSNAIAISASMAGGLQKNFGTMTKPLHVGLASQHAVQATILAREGYAGNSEVFDSRGFFNAFGGTVSTNEFHDNIKKLNFGNPYDYQKNGLSVKKFPCCYLTHRFIQGVLELREEFNLSIENVSGINVLVPQGGLMPLIHNNPVTGLQGKFSAEYTCLAALEDGYIQLQTFTSEKLNRQKIRNSFFKVKAQEYTVSPTDNKMVDEGPVYVTIELNDGEKFEKIVYHTPGSKECPMNLQEYRNKWLDCLYYYYRYSKEIDKQIHTDMIELFQQAQQMEGILNIKDWVVNINNLCQKV
ncbi:MmgE/PrpD family protein [Lentibacillus jeotgali]|uniref:MmgE/PrpD family protein n=1 Tax=Lentibacillus jeotgali TaxID=558169 RepID=UPI00026287CC|nr:MmgE/PrpD family protein [Lentibacillus jeotgali]